MTQSVPQTKASRPIRLGISGVHGRMGGRILTLALKDPDFAVTVLLEHPAHPKAAEPASGLPVSTDASSLERCDCLIEFTAPEATIEHLRLAAEHGVAMVIGTTGFSDPQLDEIRSLSRRCAVVLSSNMSVGVNVLFQTVALAARVLKDSHRAAIHEAHHRHKKDAPSGTAKTLARIIEEQTGKPVTDITSVREGEIIGDHRVIFENEEETLILEHNAKTRDIFARGALTAAKFIVNRLNGLYSMTDVLGSTP